MLSNCKGNVVNRMNLEQYKGVFIYAQQVDNKIDAIALELLGKANDLARFRNRRNSSFNRF